MTPDQQLFDELLSNSLDILRLSAGERNDVLYMIAKLEEDLIAELNRTDLSKAKRRDINKVIANANAIIGQYYGDIAVSIDIGAIALHSAEATASAFEIALGIEVLKLPSQSYFKSLAKDLLIKGSPQADWWRGQSADTAFKFAAELRQGLTAGETNQQLIARIVGKSGQPGIMDTAKRNAASLVQTAVQSVANDARRETFKSNDDIVKGIQQVSTLDSHTSVTCVAYSGCQWDLDYKPIGPKNKQLPFNGGCPRHFNCRSTEIPITKTFKELGINIPEPKGTTRASDEGQISVDTTFEGFLRRKTKTYQNEMLGEGRADLWRASKITLRDLVNGNGRPVSLKQLKELVSKRK